MAISIDLPTLFSDRLKDNGGWCERAHTASEVTAILRKKLPFPAASVYYSGRADTIVDGRIGSIIATAISSVAAQDLRNALATAEAGITGCDGLVAETGTAVLIASEDEPRILSLLPARHIVIADIRQIHADLSICLKTIRRDGAPHLPSMTLISGPSRTSDIEKTLVFGVHGPREFGVIVVGE